MDSTSKYLSDDSTALNRGMKTSQVEFQPILSPKIYEAEFAQIEYREMDSTEVRKDVIFHFWPWGYHQAESQDKVPPRFKHRGLGGVLKKAAGEVFHPDSLEVDEDRDVGAWFVRAKGWGEKLFWRDLAIQMCEKVHAALGGKPG